MFVSQISLGLSKVKSSVQEKKNSVVPASKSVSSSSLTAMSNYNIAFCAKKHIEQYDQYKTALEEQNNNRENKLSDEDIKKLLSYIEYNKDDTICRPEARFEIIQNILSEEETQECGLIELIELANEQRVKNKNKKRPAGVQFVPDSWQMDSLSRLKGIDFDRAEKILYLENRGFYQLSYDEIIDLLYYVKFEQEEQTPLDTNTKRNRLNDEGIEDISKSRGNIQNTKFKKIMQLLRIDGREEQFHSNHIIELANMIPSSIKFSNDNATLKKMSANEQFDRIQNPLDALQFLSYIKGRGQDQFSCEQIIEILKGFQKEDGTFDLNNFKKLKNLFFDDENNLNTFKLFCLIKKCQKSNNFNSISFYIPEDVYDDAFKYRFNAQEMGRIENACYIENTFNQDAYNAAKELLDIENTGGMRIWGHEISMIIESCCTKNGFEQKAFDAAKELFDLEKPYGGKLLGFQVASIIKNCRRENKFEQKAFDAIKELFDPNKTGGMKLKGIEVAHIMHACHTNRGFEQKAYDAAKELFNQQNISDPEFKPSDVAVVIKSCCTEKGFQENAYKAVKELFAPTNTGGYQLKTSEIASIIECCCTKNEFEQKAYEAVKELFNPEKTLGRQFDARNVLAIMRSCCNENGFDQNAYDSAKALLNPKNTGGYLLNRVEILLIMASCHIKNRFDPQAYKSATALFSPDYKDNKLTGYNIARIILACHSNNEFNDEKYNCAVKLLKAKDENSQNYFKTDDIVYLLQLNPNRLNIIMKNIAQGKDISSWINIQETVAKEYKNIDKRLDEIKPNLAKIIKEETVRKRVFDELDQFKKQIEIGSAIYAYNSMVASFEGIMRVMAQRHETFREDSYTPMTNGQVKDLEKWQVSEIANIGRNTGCFNPRIFKEFNEQLREIRNSMHISPEKDGNIEVTIDGALECFHKLFIPMLDAIIEYDRKHYMPISDIAV